MLVLFQSFVIIFLRGYFTQNWNERENQEMTSVDERTYFGNALL
jgi:hypothetical protein